MESFPEIFSKRLKSIKGEENLQGWMHFIGIDQPLGAVTSIWGHITYNASFYGSTGVPVPSGREMDFFQTIAHEMQHVQATFLERMVTSFGDIEDTIDSNADIMMRIAYQKFANRRAAECFCQR